MRIKTFSAKSINGFMNFAFEFKDDLTFLTGINGSGKTSVVNLLTASLQPSIRYLAKHTFSELEIELKIPSERNLVSIKMEKEETTLQIRFSGVSSPLTFQIPADVDFSGPEYKREEAEEDLYRASLATLSQHEVYKAISTLPKPIFLGIERRIYDETNYDPAFDRPLNSRRRARFLRNRIRGVLGVSLEQAVEIAEDQYSQVRYKLLAIEDSLKNKILQNSLVYVEDRPGDLEFLPIEELDRQKTIISDTYKAIGLPVEQVEPNLNMFFTNLSTISKDLDNQIIQNLFAGKSIPTKAETALSQWLINYPQYNRLKRIVEFARVYIDETDAVNLPIERYLKNVNRFFADSNKRLFFGKDGRLTLNLNESEVPISSLSSGERQILVMITHLSFLPENEENIFIVDEPELSLHVKWQELFVDSIYNANQNIQLILATHSPSIILDRVENCVDLTSLNRG